MTKMILDDKFQLNDAYDGTEVWLEIFFSFHLFFLRGVSAVFRVGPEF